MALYRYVKKYTSKTERFFVKVSYGLILVGSLFLFWSFYPVISYEIYSYLFIQNNYFSPVPHSTETSAHQRAQGIVKDHTVFSTNLVDYTKATSWFPRLSNTDSKEQKVFSIKEYTLSIPKLDIYDARVLVGGDDLSNALVQYQPKVLPGEFGVSSIFGHSTHPSLVKKTGVQKYMSIFTYLPTLDIGDTVLVTVGETSYEFTVEDKFEVKPSAVEVLEQKYDNSYLNIITCVPVGQTARRLIVRAKLNSL